ncbi:MAG: phosphoribosylglycinamide formyltransferase [Planctomycetota bacterium]
MSSPAIAVLASGGGRSVENLADKIRAGELDARLALVLTDRPCGVLERCARLEIPTLALDWKEIGDAEEFARRAFAAIEQTGAELVVLAGFLRLLVVPDRWLGRVLNIHPSLLPAFGGKGYYGDRVHRAVLEHGVQFTGCTVHQVDNEYDQGQIVLQRVVEVRPDDTVESLGTRVFEEERIALPAAIAGALAASAG